MNEEIWKAIPGHEGYEASSLGRIRSIDRVLDVVASIHGPAHRRSVKGRILRPSLAGNYEYVSLGHATKGGVHRFVAFAFRGPPPFDGAEAAHGDGQFRNNAEGNIAWKTRAENEADKLGHGTYFGRGGVKGETHHKAKLTNDQVCAIRAASTGSRGERTGLAAAYRVNRSTIGRVLDGKGWSHV